MYLPAKALLLSSLTALTGARDVVTATDFDAAGNQIMAGYTYSSLPGYTSAGKSDCFVGKYSSTGVQQWLVQLGTSGEDGCWDVSTDSSNNIYVTGYTDGAWSGQTAKGGLDILVLRLTSAGVLSWVRQAGTTANDVASAVAVDTSDRAIVAGFTMGTLSGQSSAGGMDAFFMRYTTSGTANVTEQFGTSGDEEITAVTVDSSNRNFFTGHTTGSFAGASNAGWSDAFVARYAANGNQSWIKQLGTAEDEIPLGIAVSSAGISYLTGLTYGAMPGNSSAGNGDIFMASYSLTGAQSWLKQTGTSADDFTQSIALDSSSNIYVAGATGGAFPGKTSAGGMDAFTAKYTSAGVLSWMDQFGTTGTDSAVDIASNTGGITSTGGFTEGSFPGYTNPGGWDGFFCRHTTAGTKSWIKQLGM